MKAISITLTFFLLIANWTFAESTDVFTEDFNELTNSLQPAKDEAIPASVLGWTHTPPSGWSIDNSKMGPVAGVTEWQGWSFATMAFWTSADTQDRASFTRSDGVFAIADPDEWEDQNHPSVSGTFNSVLSSPPIQVSAHQRLYLYFDSHYRQEDTQQAQVRVSFDGSPDIVLLDYSGNPDANNKGMDVENAQVALPIPTPTANGTMVLKWDLFHATNDWYWAIDNVRVSTGAPPPTPTPTLTPTPTAVPVPMISKGPLVYIRSEGSARILWETMEPGSSIIEYGKTELNNRVEDKTPKTKHEMLLSHLERGTEYSYAIKSVINGEEKFGGTFLFDSTFDGGPGEFPATSSPYSRDTLTPLYEHAAERIVEQTGVDKGYCLVWGFGEGRLAYEIAKRTHMRVLGIEEDPSKIATARKLLHKAGVYGDRISVQQGSLSQLPYREYFANLIVSDSLLATGQISGSPAEMLRVLRPCGGIVYLGQPKGAPHRIDPEKLEEWLASGGITGCTVVENASGSWVTKVREPLADIGEWTHFYAEPGNSACSGDRLVQFPMQMLWYGRPGPRLIINRHSRPMSSLVKNGRVFIPADDRIIAIDAYNGTRLWDLCVPGSRRLGAFKGSGQMALTDEYLYIAQHNQCHAVDVKTGLPALTLEAPQPLPGERRDWGYVACVGDQIFGAGHKVGTPFYQYTSNGNCDVLEGDGRVSMVSDYLFAEDRFTGRVLWTYAHGAILESAIACGDGRVYFAENRNLPAPKGQWEDRGRRWVGDFTAGENTYLVALDARDGSKVWEQPVHLPFSEMMYLCYAQGTALTTGSYYLEGKCTYGLFAYEADTGQPKWNDHFDTGFGPGGSHGEQWQHPVIMGDRIFLRPYDFDLQTGARGLFRVQKGGGCGTFSASSDYLFARDSNPTYYKYEERLRDHGPVCQVTRPGCFINILPAGGLVLIPESSSGCTCDYSVQTSLAFVAK